MNVTRFTENVIAINEAHRAAQNGAATAVEKAILCGKLLTETKKAGKADGSIPHGAWKEWVLANCEFSYPSAHAYMKAAKHARSSGLVFTSLRHALGYESSPKSPRERPRAKSSALSNLSPLFDEDAVQDVLNELHAEIDVRLVTALNSLAAKADRSETETVSQTISEIWGRKWTN
jgi:hypothetical protein